MQAKILVDTAPALRALEQLQEDAPRVIGNELRNLAQDAAASARAKAPGRLRQGVKVEDAAKLGNGAIGAVVIVNDIPIYSPEATDGRARRVARWTNHGTRGNADRRAVKKPGRVASREPGTGIKPQRWLRPVSQAKRKKAIENALIRTARKLGFDVSGGVS